ncbi:HAD family hydrolase [Kordiimonas aestuarii]|uniref:hypothetical protein n=1 Tax=Kordiimonas aestuarii TaxID=1005925 RepID=UPI0021D33D96|nr:hypothetical protein [Kordiimonas aestuarii]
MKRLVVDIDNTMTIPGDDYAALEPNQPVIEQLRAYKAQGFEIVLYSSRNMRTHENNLGKITAKTVPTLVKWLETNGIPYDEIWMGKPWCGHDGFYIDDRAVRPNEFVEKTYEEIRTLLEM